MTTEPVAATDGRPVLTSGDVAHRLGISIMHVMTMARKNVIDGAMFFTNGERQYVFFDPETFEKWLADGAPGITDRMRRKLARKGIVPAEEPRNVQRPVAQPADPELEELV